MPLAQKYDHENHCQYREVRCQYEHHGCQIVMPVKVRYSLYYQVLINVICFRTCFGTTKCAVLPTIRTKIFCSGCPQTIDQSLCLCLTVTYQCHAERNLKILFIFDLSWEWTKSLNLKKSLHLDIADIYFFDFWKISISLYAVQWQVLMKIWWSYQLNNIYLLWVESLWHFPVSCSTCLES